MTEIILRDEHLRLQHCEQQQLLFAIRQKYWPIAGGHEARKVVRSCVPCFRYRPKTPKIIMGQLLESRLNVQDYPFQTTGVDYAGPIKIKESKRRGNIPIHKVYIAVFTCFASKAVHLKLVTDLTTEAFMAAFRRFISRRGVCAVMYSDNGTNFVGAANKLEDLFKFLSTNTDTIKKRLSARSIK